VERAALQRRDAFGDELRPAVDQSRLLGPVGKRLSRDFVVVGLVGLPEIRGVRERDRALLPHPVEGGARVEAAGKRNADVFAGGKCLQDSPASHSPTIITFAAGAVRSGARWVQAIAAVRTATKKSFAEQLCENAMTFVARQTEQSRRLIERRREPLHLVELATNTLDEPTRG
jgi:hypothetical protein